MANLGDKKVRKVKNTGTIYFDNTTNQWVGQIEIGKYYNGRTKYKRFYGNSQNSVLEKMRIYKDNHECEVLLDESYNSNKDIVNKYFEVFLQSIKKSKLKPASFTREIGTFKNHISPYIGEYRLANLTPSIIQNELINGFEKLRNDYNNGKFIFPVFASSNKRVTAGRLKSVPEYPSSVEQTLRYNKK